MNWDLVRDNVDSPVVSALLTLIAFQLGVSLYRVSGNRVWLHPVLVGAVVIAGGLKLLNLSYATYLTNCTIVMFFLGPLIVALAVPLRAELMALRGIAVPALITVLLGSFAAPLAAIGCAYLMGADQQVLLSLIPKSVTSPIAINLSEIVGGLVALSAAITVFTGVIGAFMAPFIFRLVGLTDDRLQGLVLGINCHGLGTSRAFEISVRCGALAGLGMGLTGCFSAFMLPYLALELF